MALYFSFIFWYFGLYIFGIWTQPRIILFFEVVSFIWYNHNLVKKIEDCQEEKKAWFDYVLRFISENVETDSEFYGGLYERVNTAHADSLY